MLVAASRRAIAEEQPQAAEQPWEQFQLQPIGHNLFGTTYLLRKSQRTIGTYYIGDGVRDYLTVATSPWIWANYNMANLELKAGTAIDTQGSRVSMEAFVFDSLPTEWGNYEQKSVFLRATLSRKFSSLYTLHFGIGYQYFWNDVRPYSLRPLPWNNDRYTLSIGGLHEFRLSPRNGILFESGVLGANYKLPFLHLGLSFHRTFSWGFAQLGLSVSMRRTPQAPSAPAPFTDAYNSWVETYLLDRNSDYYIQQNDATPNLDPYLRPIMVHPEIQLQFSL